MKELKNTKDQKQKYKTKSWVLMFVSANIILRIPQAHRTIVAFHREYSWYRYLYLTTGKQ
jgi:hypothetical protein